MVGWLVRDQKKKTYAQKEKKEKAFEYRVGLVWCMFCVVLSVVYYVRILLPTYLPTYLLI